MRLVRKLLKPSLQRVFPPRVLNLLANEWYLYKVRKQFSKLKDKYSGQCDLLINVGTGFHGREGWVNVDAYPDAGVNCLLDCRHELPFPDSSARGIYSEHFFEHLRYPDESGRFLVECRRVLQPGCVLRLIVPDGEAYLKAFLSKGWKEMAEVRPLDENRTDPWNISFETKMEVVNEMFRQNDEHKFAYDFETLELHLVRAGFTKIIRSEFGRSMNDQLVLDMPYRKPGSLYVEAVA